jgi:FecR protein
MAGPVQLACGGYCSLSGPRFGTGTGGGLNGRHPGLKLHISPIVVASILLFGGIELAWSDEKIGGAEIVINNVQGALPTGSQIPVAQGDSVFLNEAVQSGADSKARLLLEDNTNVSIGPGSTLKLDRFVYSGPKQPGTIALNIGKGTLRFVTGDASKRAYTIWTPTAAIGVRGTILRIDVSPTETRVINEEGTAIVCHRQRNEYASVEELRKRRCKAADLPTRKEEQTRGSCGCAELLVPNQQATISQSQIAVTEAPVGAISDPIIAEGFAGGFFAPPIGAAALGLGAIAAAAIGGAATSSGNPTPFAFVSSVSP